MNTLKSLSRIIKIEISVTSIVCILVVASWLLFEKLPLSKSILLVIMLFWLAVAVARALKSQKVLSRSATLVALVVLAGVSLFATIFLFVLQYMGSVGFADVLLLATSVCLFLFNVILLGVLLLNR